MKRFIPLLILMSLWITEAVAQAPGAPTGLRVTAVGDRKITLSWIPPSNTGDSAIRYYRIYYARPDGGGGDDATLLNGNLTPVTSYLIDVHNFGTYTCRVHANNNDGQGPASASVEATPAIPAPTNFTATLDDPTTEERTVTLSWTAPSPIVAAITGYKYSQDGGEYIDTDSGTTPSQTITGLKNGRSYTFRVRAKRVTNNIEETATPSRTVTVTPLINAPGAPGTLNVQRVDDTATLTWSPPSDTETIIRYEYSADGGSTWQSTGSTDTTYTVTGLEPGETYTFLVRAVYIDGDTSRIISHRSRSSNSAVLTLPKPKQRIIIWECPVGWQRTDRFGGRTPRVLIYEVNLEMDLQNLVSIYKPDSVAIYVHPDEGLENLDGWKLQVAVPYNHHREYLLTTENSVIVASKIEDVEGGFAFIANPEETPFPMIGMGFTGAHVPGFDYRLYDDTGRKVDFGIACYKQGGIFQALKDMEDPRVLRNVLLETLDWDAATYIRSEWTVPVPVPAAPSLIKKIVVGTWANLKKQ